MGLSAHCHHESISAPFQESRGVNRTWHDYVHVCFVSCEKRAYTSLQAVEMTEEKHHMEHEDYESSTIPQEEINDSHFESERSRGVLGNGKVTAEWFLNSLMMMFKMSSFNLRF